ncbi:hypothetical protein [Georgenia ruanii]|uniref:hypothetical protein n=1 Tax=Georgenia ruanii TaxID=348442 RepID=UPI00186B03DE|nr:hypothetical protein [Georgenia ruanii]
MTFAAALAAERPDEVALRDPEQTFGWADVDDYLRPALNALQAEPLRDERRVAVFAPEQRRYAARPRQLHVGGCLRSGGKRPAHRG